ncbi:UbiA family prenyltransferase [Nocardioides panacisoli]|uniref:UbiA family prenyltransferase n=1 Tax=Nocardioides panacisoli TaxID=627624 RepID=UPI001C6362EC|nr:UbiA family prenyltransferase [Nocardioides panacisoli]QYJ02701.1 UbiA family prenyltransferase [Nocardioides panacisoli]
MAIMQRWRRRDPATEEDARPRPAPPSAGAPDRSPHRDAATTQSADSPSGSLLDSPALLLVRAAHPKQGALTAAVVFGVAVLAGRPAREAGVILATVLTGQAILGWHNDLVDRRRDRAHEATGKPLADGRLSPANTWFALILAALLLLPLSITTGITAGMIYLASVAVGMLGNVLFRTTPLSWWSWAASYAMLPAYLTYGGWGGQATGAPPETAITVLAALIGVGVHFLRSVWGLVGDHQDGWNSLPLKVGLKLGATRLLMLSSVYLGVMAVVTVVVASQVGIAR